MTVIIASVLSALLTSLLTWSLAYVFYRARLSEQVDALREELAEEVEARVRAGAIAAGQELLPSFRREVTEGFREAMRGVARGDMAKEMAKTGAGIVGGSLDTLFGGKKRSRIKPW